MGNVVAAPIPSRILPVEEYINEISDMHFVQSLGSTRFMKVARVNLKDGPAVCKVFLPYDPSFSVEPYMTQVVGIRDFLSSEPNCLPFEKVYLTPRCALLLRPFQKQTLYERLSTRPFLIEVEKKWIAFQLFKALAQCEGAGVGICHGDLKTQNVLVSSSTWIYITDFASYKPACIPSDDPSYFHFFFDTSRRLSCYLAPERFQPSQELTSHPVLPGEFTDVSKDLTHAMDIFSLGCVLIELLTEGRFPFTYERIIRYKYSDVDGANKLIQRILEYIPEEWRPVIGLMLDRNPAKRPRGSSLLRHYAAELFPPVFTQFIYNYMLAFRPRFVTPGIVPEEPAETGITIMEPDDVIAKLHTDMDLIIKNLCEKSYGEAQKDKLGEKLCAPAQENQTCASVLFISLVTSNIRMLKSLSAKLTSMNILQRLALISDSTIVVDRILPYLMNFLSDSSVQVRGEAIYAITALLSSFKEIPISENRLFVDYIFPRLKILSTDRAVFPRMALAVSLGELAETSVKFLMDSSSNLTADFLKGTLADETVDKGKEEEVLTRLELEALHEAVNEIFVNLCGGDNNIKLCLVTPQSLEKLCLFFHRQRCNFSQFLDSPFATDVLLSHMITFLNDKVDWRLRATFFQCCTITAKYVGRQSAFILRSLLQQGLHDYEEFVQLRTLQCIHELCKEQLLDKTSIFELLPDFVPFLAHPNEWLRLSVVDIVCLLDNILNIADVYCKLTPLVKSYLKEDLIRMNKKFIVASCLTPPIPRNIWSYVVDKTPVDELLEYLSGKRLLISLDGGPQSMFASDRSLRPASASLESCLKRLKNLGLNDDCEEKLIKFENVLTKMVQFRASICASPPTETYDDTLDLASLQPAVIVRSFDLKGPDFKFSELGTKLLGSTGPKDTAATKSSETRCDLNASGSYVGIGVPLETIRSSASIVQLSELLTHKRERYLRQRRLPASSYPQISTMLDSSKRPIVPSLSPATRLVANLHEHSGAITSMVLNPAGTEFASASSDGAVKLWSVLKFNSQFTAAIKSDATYSYRRKIFSIQYLGSNGDHLAIAAGDRSITIIDAKRDKVLKTKTLEWEDGHPIQLLSAGNFLYILSHHGSVYCLDYRQMVLRLQNKFYRCASQDLVWEFKAKDKYGLITSFCVDPGGKNWMSLTSTGGDVILWDLRFGLEVKSWQYRNSRLLKCWPAYPCGTNCFKEVWTASSCNGELSRWSLETGERSHNSKLVTTALTTCAETGRIFTGDNAGAIRSYNLKSEKDCFYLSGPERRTAEEVSATGDSWAGIKFDRSIIKTIDTIYQLPHDARQRHSSTPSNTSPLDNQVTICHRSAISEIFRCGDYLVSSSRDGIIKVWC